MYNTINNASNNDLKIPYRKDNPLVGDILMCQGHIGIVTDVKDGMVYWANMGVKTAASIQSEFLSILVRNGGNKYVVNFWGFWTPDDSIVDELIKDNLKNKPAKDFKWCCDECMTKYALKK
jgi:hypothetical protein